MDIPYRLVELVKAGVLLLASREDVIDLSETDRSFISATLDGHALKT